MDVNVITHGNEIYVCDGMRIMTRFRNRTVDEVVAYLKANLKFLKVKINDDGWYK